jgi:hypothetical protein
MFKSQTNPNVQNYQTSAAIVFVGGLFATFDIWRLEIVWDLVLGIWDLTWVVWGFDIGIWTKT